MIHIYIIIIYVYTIPNILLHLQLHQSNNIFEFCKHTFLTRFIMHISFVSIALYCT